MPPEAANRLDVIFVVSCAMRAIFNVTNSQLGLPLDSFRIRMEFLQPSLSSPVFDLPSCLCLVTT
jgi:hypothetical protein